MKSISYKVYCILHKRVFLEKFQDHFWTNFGQIKNLLSVPKVMNILTYFMFWDKMKEKRMYLYIGKGKRIREQLAWQGVPSPLT